MNERDKAIIENAAFLIDTGERNRANIAARLGLEKTALELIWRRGAKAGDTRATDAIAATRTEVRGWAQW